MNRIKENKLRNFTIVPNELINDPSLHPISQAIYTWMASKPDNFKFNQKTILRFAHMSDPKTLGKYMNPLLQKKWLHRTRERNEEGKLGIYEYYVNATSGEKSTNGPVGDFSTVEKNHSGKIPHYNNKEYSNNKEIKKKKEFAPPHKNDIYLYILPLIRSYCKLPADAAKSWAKWETVKIFEHYEDNGWKASGRKLKSWERAAKNWINRAAERGQFLKYDPSHPEYGKSTYAAPEKPQHKETIPSEIRELANRLKSK